MHLMEIKQNLSSCGFVSYIVGSRSGQNQVMIIFYLYSAGKLKLALASSSQQIRQGHYWPCLKLKSHSIEVYEMITLSRDPCGNHGARHAFLSCTVVVSIPADNPVCKTLPNVRDAFYISAEHR